jgi:hypothetical protein
LTALTSQAQIVISQVYGGGGNTGAPYTNDFIELFNRGTAAVDISGYSVQYASGGGGTWAATTIPAGTSIAPGKYYLIKQAGGANGIALPTPDLDVTTSPFAMGGQNGKVALVSNSTLLTGTNPASSTYVDLVGYGTSVGFEGTAAVAALSNTTAAKRNNNGCTDNNQNSTDFTVGAPTPRNSATAAYSCSAPSLSILTPTNNQVFNPDTTSINLTFSVNNFVVANGTGSGNIQYTINSGTAVNVFDVTAPTVLSGLTPGTYTVTAQLVDNTSTALSPSVNGTATFTIASYNVVTDLATLRADVVANGANRYYQVSSSPVVTYARTTRNQKYVQDASGAILIDDVPGTITTAVTRGDALAGLKGQATLFGGLLQFVPSANATVASSGNVVTPQVVTIADLNSAVTAATYESELVQLNVVTFDTTTPNFPTSATNVNLTSGTDSVTFRTLFTEADYMGTAKPTAATNIIALVGRNNTIGQVTSRDLADINVPLSSSTFNQIAGLKMYPNPTKNILNIETALNGKVNVAIINVLGQEVINTITVNNSVNVAELTKGIYVVKVTEEGKTATNKLVIE